MTVADNDAGPTAAYLRVYNDDPWRYTVKEELEKRGFKHVDVRPACRSRGRSSRDEAHPW